MTGLLIRMFLVVWCGVTPAMAQSFRFAHVTDTHVGGSTGVDDLRATVGDINRQSNLDFVIISGDITEFGSDDELVLAKQVLDSIAIPWYVVPGNHDTNWSESGGNSFRRVFGNETFAFKHKGYFFVGTNSGPNMRMSPGQVPRENLVWMDSLFAANPDTETPLIYINHYPQDSSLNNWFEAIDRLKTRNVQLMICGHGHQNKVFDAEGVPSVMSRSNLRARDSIGAYNIVTIGDGEAVYQLRYPGVRTEEPWARIELQNHQFSSSESAYPRPDYRVNNQYPGLQVAWTYQDDNDIGAGIAIYKQRLITANTGGEVFALNARSGKKTWAFQTGGKVYSTPEVWKNYVVVGSTDNHIYCLNAKNGKLVWKYEADKAVLGSPLIHEGVAYIGASDGKFRALDIRTGELLWSFDEVKGYVSAKPLWYDGNIYFGCWGNGFYALDPSSGARLWEWTNGSLNRMLSPAACYPVGTNGRIFIVAPDRYMTALDAHTGAEIWRHHVDTIRVRESMGLAADSQYVYVKTMDGNVYGMSTTADGMEVAWTSELQLPYELTPSAIATNDEQVFVPSHSGLLSALDGLTGDVLWQYKISNGMINPILPMGRQQVVASTMDGKIVKLIF